jgi:hypothetical protein
MRNSSAANHEMPWRASFERGPSTATVGNLRQFSPLTCEVAHGTFVVLGGSGQLSFPLGAHTVLT